MSRFYWALLGFFAAFLFRLIVRRKPPGAEEIAKEVVLAQAEAEAHAKVTATKDCERCHREVPDWFAEEILEEEICFACSESKPYPGPGETEDAYVAAWIADKEERKWADRAHVPEPEMPRSILEPPEDK